ncbi:MoaD/ThiS family protein [Yeosuana sp. MJ-SS3]|uniref:MoaD/ThiS family protein n=1 Tax=Gilvirhabdus luticola TaxID=3079858 RepID=A0ABU3U421_9FLAO|nr:MoaD/ThiS family protein [Yeosuana sp. MJ-SS3]MDU8885072.1 MoaD/ThiS family protein [Yeosuana sp. MJ-SS3]
MVLNIKYFGLLTEITKCSEENIEFSKSSVLELLNLLFNKYPELKHKDFEVAQNNKIVSKDTMVSETEIALLPPFSGG